MKNKTSSTLTRAKASHAPVAQGLIPLKANKTHCWIGLLGLVMPLAYADDAPIISNDPTRAQQPAQVQQIMPAKPGNGFQLPQVSRPSVLNGIGKTLVIKSVQFAGNSAIPTQELEALAQPYLNRPLTAADFETLRRKISLFYVEKGYVNSGAVINNQSLASGLLKITIIEGKLTEIKQNGQGRLPESYLRDRLILGSGDPLNVNKLQDSYRLLLGNPLIERLNGRLLPGKNLGEATLDVTVTRARPYQMYAGTDNYQTPSVGEVTGRMGGWVDNLLKMGEHIDGQVSINGGSTGYNTGIAVPVSAHDTRVSFRYSSTYSNIIEAPLNVLNINSNIIGYDAGIAHPVYRTFKDELTLGLNFVVRQNRTTLANNCISTTPGINDCNTQATVLRMSQHYSHRGDSNNGVFWSTFNAGLNALGATTNPGQQSGQFFSWLGQSMFSQKVLDNGAAVVLKANIQLSDSPLLNQERYSVGGAYTVRGYRENTYVRDNGFNASLEFKYPLLTAAMADKGSLFLVPFMDYGGAWNNPTSITSKMPTDYLHSVGVGFNWKYQKLSTDFYWAHAIASVNNPQKNTLPHDIQDDGIHFRVNMNAF